METTTCSRRSPNERVCRKLFASLSRKKFYRGGKSCLSSRKRRGFSLSREHCTTFERLYLIEDFEKKPSKKSDQDGNDAAQNSLSQKLTIFSRKCRRKVFHNDEAHLTIGINRKYSSPTRHKNDSPELMSTITNSTRKTQHLAAIKEIPEKRLNSK